MNSPFEITPMGMMCNTMCKHYFFREGIRWCGLFAQDLKSLNGNIVYTIRCDECLLRDETLVEDTEKEFNKDIENIHYKFNKDYIPEVIEQVLALKEDFVVHGYRFIRDDSIDDILALELRSMDAYDIGSHGKYAIAAALGVYSGTIEYLTDQGGDSNYRGLGELILEIDGAIKRLAKFFRENSCYHEHFGCGNTSDEITIAGIWYHIFEE